jgi:hypothetical protein
MDMWHRRRLVISRPNFEQHCPPAYRAHGIINPTIGFGNAVALSVSLSPVHALYSQRLGMKVRRRSLDCGSSALRSGWQN